METAHPNVLVVPELEPRLKHATIFSRFDALAPGEELVIINDHDPKPLHYQLEAMKGNIFTWEYLESGPEVWRIRITKTAEETDVLNVTLIEPRMKHPTIFAKFDSLQPGESFILFNDHDPKPLYFQLSQMRGDIFTWEYLEQGPYDFRILITKKPLPATEKNTVPAQSTADASDEVLDVTQIEHRLKHPAIFQKFDNLKPGEGFILRNDHDPKPLYYQMMGERGDIFTWEYLEKGPEVWRIRIAKKASGPAEETLGAIVAKDLGKAEVFKKYGIDFCCGGNKTVRQACEEKGINVSLVEKDLQESGKHNSATAQRPLPYNDWNLDFLADYIMNTHHTYVKKMIPDLKMYADKVARVHGGRHPELIEINQLVQQTMDEMATHTEEEETVVFPFIKSIVKGEAGNDKFNSVKDPINLMIQDHQVVGDNMDRIREISNNYSLPEDACASYTYLFKNLDEFEDDLHIHIHLENNILFPKAIKLEKGEKA